MCIPSLVAFIVFASLGQSPTVELKDAPLVVRESCRIRLPAGPMLDPKRLGVVQIAASDIVVEFPANATLFGSRKETSPDEFEGFAIRIDGQKNVTIRGARINGYRSAIYARQADGLVLENIEVLENRRSRLNSTALTEDESDWLSPHDNDNNEWLNSYGVAIYIEDSNDVTVRRCKVRKSQNGLVLDRVSGAQIYDNDFSFLSGWGIALWRAERNTISRNACDFCIRGYSHGQYNRGQDSAGILAFEQCSNNVFAENSATHCGDGLFAFAGKEAMGERSSGKTAAVYAAGQGCNSNIIVGNDFSYAAAHGIEITFSFDNQILNNKLIENAICGLWGGYSRNSTIAENDFRGNGDAGYGLERGGVNIEHGKNNRIIRNSFQKNKCGVHLWWDEDTHITSTPWAKTNGIESSNNLIAANSFHDDELAIQLRGKGNVTVGSNTMAGVGTAFSNEPEVEIDRKPELKAPSAPKPELKTLGESHPVGARKELAGRENIIMSEWGPWDHEAPLVRLMETGRNTHVYQFLKMPGRTTVSLMGAGLTGKMLPEQQGRMPYIVSAKMPGVYPYTLSIGSGDFKVSMTGTLVAVLWRVTFFQWEIDPRQDFDGWLMSAGNSDAVTVLAQELVCSFKNGGPEDLGLGDELKDDKVGKDQFGLIAKARVSLSKGKWKFTTLSDDGVRLLANGKTLIDNWTHHVPTRDEGVLELDAQKEVDLVVYYFELNGYATLSLSIDRVR